MGSDGQVTVGTTVMKRNAKKVRRIHGNRVLAGFAGATADAFTLFEKFEAKLSQKVKHVLVVEDDARQRDSIAQLIGEDDVQITAVELGSEALPRTLATTIGVIWTPSFIDLNIAIDYFDIEVNDEVAKFGAGNILASCYRGETSAFPNDFCTLISRNGAVGPDAYDITLINDNYLNINSQVNRGIDLTTRYRHEADFGNFIWDTQFTWQLQRQEAGGSWTTVGSGTNAQTNTGQSTNVNMKSPIVGAEERARRIVVFGTCARRWSACVRRSAGPMDQDTLALLGRARAGRRERYTDELESIDLPAAWRSLTADVLVLHGGRDDFIDRDDAHALADLLARRSVGATRFREFAEVDHSLAPPSPALLAAIAGFAAGAGP